MQRQCPAGRAIRAASPDHAVQQASAGERASLAALRRTVTAQCLEARHTAPHGAQAFKWERRGRRRRRRARAAVHAAGGVARWLRRVWLKSGLHHCVSVTCRDATPSRAAAAAPPPPHAAAAAATLLRVLRRTAVERTMKATRNFISIAVRRCPRGADAVCVTPPAHAARAGDARRLAARARGWLRNREGSGGGRLERGRAGERGRPVLPVAGAGAGAAHGAGPLDARGRGD